MLLSPPSHLGYPLPSSGFSIVQNVPLPSRSVLRSLQGQARVPRPPGASSGSLLTPECLLAGLPSPLSRWASYNLFVPILTFRTQDSPPGHCPSFYQLHHYCTCPICAGERAMSLTSPWPASWASPRERSLWPTPRPGCCHLSHPTHCPPQKGCGCRGHHPNNALLPSTVTPNKSRDKEAENRVISTAPWLFWGGSGVSGVTGVKTPAAQLPKAPDNPPACPPLHTWATPPSLD